MSKSRMNMCKLPGIPYPSPKETLWRYLSFEKFASLLSTKSLYFARADQFKDPFEGHVPQSITDMYERENKRLGKKGSQAVTRLRNLLNMKEHYDKYMKTLFGLLVIVLLVGCSEDGDIEESSLLNDWEVVKMFLPIEGEGPSRTVYPAFEDEWILTFNPDGSLELKMSTGFYLYNGQIEHTTFRFQENFRGDFTLNGREITISIKEVVITSNAERFMAAGDMVKEEYAQEVFKREVVSGNYTIWLGDNRLLLTKSDGKAMHLIRM